METEASIRQNLQAAGCDAQTAEQFFDCWNSRDLGGGIKLLENHRRVLLEQVHAKERCISCLDYLVYELEKEDRKA